MEKHAQNSIVYTHTHLGTGNNTKDRNYSHIVKLSANYLLSQKRKEIHVQLNGKNDGIK